MVSFGGDDNTTIGGGGRRESISSPNMKRRYSREMQVHYTELLRQATVDQSAGSSSLLKSSSSKINEGDEEDVDSLDSSDSLEDEDSTEDEETQNMEKNSFGSLNKIDRKNSLDSTKSLDEEDSDSGDDENIQKSSEKMHEERSFNSLKKKKDEKLGKLQSSIGSLDSLEEPDGNKTREKTLTIDNTTKTAVSNESTRDVDRNLTQPSHNTKESTDRRIKDEQPKRGDLVTSSQGAEDFIDSIEDTQSKKLDSADSSPNDTEEVPKTRRNGGLQRSYELDSSSDLLSNTAADSKPQETTTNNKTTATEDNHNTEIAETTYSNNTNTLAEDKFTIDLSTVKAFDIRDKRVCRISTKQQKIYHNRKEVRAARSVSLHESRPGMAIGLRSQSLADENFPTISKSGNELSNNNNNNNNNSNKNNSNNNKNNNNNNNNNNNSTDSKDIVHQEPLNNGIVQKLERDHSEAPHEDEHLTVNQLGRHGRYGSNAESIKEEEEEDEDENKGDTSKQDITKNNLKIENSSVSSEVIISSSDDISTRQNLDETKTSEAPDTLTSKPSKATTSTITVTTTSTSKTTPTTEITTTTATTKTPGTTTAAKTTARPPTTVNIKFSSLLPDIVPEGKQRISTNTNTSEDEQEGTATNLQKKKKKKKKKKDENENLAKQDGAASSPATTTKAKNVEKQNLLIKEDIDQKTKQKGEEAYSLGINQRYIFLKILKIHCH